MKDDTIKRSDAVVAIANLHVSHDREEIFKAYAKNPHSMTTDFEGTLIDAINAVEALPPADIPHSDDWEKYSDRLWKNAYERGKADRPQGEWIWHEDEYICNCSRCDFEIDAEGCIEPMEYVGLFRYCPNCGARMKGADDETD